MQISVTCLEIADPRWKDFVSAHPDATVFHHPAWAELLAECYGYRSFAGVLTDTTNKVVSGLPLIKVDSWLTGQRLVALPFSDFCPPLAANDATLDSLIQKLRTWRERHDWPAVEIRWPLSDQHGVHQGKGVARHVTNLVPDPQQVFSGFKKTRVQQPISQAEERGVTIKRGEGWDDLRLFYDLHLQTRQRLGTPIQPLRFFRLLWERLFSQGLGFVLLAYKGSQPLAGAVFLHWNSTLTYKFSASDPAYWDLRPNNLLLWHAIRWGCEHGYELFDWGKSDLDNKGLRNFKGGWGSQESIYHYSILGDGSPSLADKGVEHNLLRKVIQHSPVWVCRAIGELLYGHFA